MAPCLRWISAACYAMCGQGDAPPVVHEPSAPRAGGKVQYHPSEINLRRSSVKGVMWHIRHMGNSHGSILEIGVLSCT